MKKSNNRTLRFDTQKNVRSTRTKRFVAAFSCFFVLLAGISFLLLLNHYDFNLSAMVAPGAEESTTEKPTNEHIPVVSGEQNFLMLCTADSDNTVHFAVILNADMDSRTLSLIPLDTSALYIADSVPGTLSEHITSGAEQQLIKAIETTKGIAIDKYIRSTDSGFKSLITAFGGYHANIEKAIDVRTDKLTAIISEGEQLMTGDTLLKYIRCYNDNPTRQAEIIADLITQKLTPSNFRKADSYYTKIINLVASDISVLDFNRIKNGIEALLYDNETVFVSVR